MTYQPVIPSGGLVGWTFLKRTYDAQAQVFQNSASMVRDTDYFEAKIGEIKTAEELVSDRRLLRVTLGAFGLQDDIDNKFLIRKILEEGTLSDDALANKMTDERYGDLSKAFGFGDFDTPRTQLSYFGKEITDAYRERQFEVAVGNQDDDLRLALNLEREIGDIASGSDSDDTKWFRIMGNAPLRSVFETALGLPSSFSQLDIDKQLEVLRDKTDRLFGDGEVSQFSETEPREKLVQSFLLRSQLSGQSGVSSGQIALSLLQSISASRTF